MTSVLVNEPAQSSGEDGVSGQRRPSEDVGSSTEWHGAILS